MAQRMDTYIPDYANNVALTSGTPWYGQLIPLYGSAGFSVQFALTNGAAGSYVIAPSNFESVTALLNANGYPPARNSITATMSANGGGDATYTINNAQNYFRSIYIYFTPTASGNLYIAVNVRRISN